jgi:aminopeptidase
MRDPRLTRLADLLVNYSIGVKKDQTVRIAAPTGAAPLIAELYRHVLLAGGHPIVRINLEELSEIFVRDASTDQLGYVYPLNIEEIKTLDATIGIWGESNTRSMTNVYPTRLAAISAARKPITEIYMRRAAKGELKWVGTQYPTAACAQDAEMSTSEYEDFVFRAGLLHEADPVGAWKKISERQQRLADYLNGKSDYRVVTPQGTDVRMSVAGMRWVNCDGHENFPDGEVFTGPVIDSVEGTIAFSFPAVHQGREVVGAKLTFKHGKVVDASASKGEDFLISMLDMDEGARKLGECAIGTNYSITRYTRNTLFDEKIGGTVHFAVGAGYPETGNCNVSGLHWDMVVDLRKGGEIHIDGEIISRDGKFARADFPR